MIPTILTGTNDVVYQGFPPWVFSAWTQPLLKAVPYHYLIGEYNIQATSPAFQHYSPCPRPNDLFNGARNVITINAAIIGVYEALAKSGV